jgi:hypothetical protein
MWGDDSPEALVRSVPAQTSHFFVGTGQSKPGPYVPVCAVGGMRGIPE